MSITVGVDNLHYAIMNNEDTEAYDTPIKIPGVSLITITPNAEIEAIMTGRGPMEKAGQLGLIEIEIASSDIDSDVKAVLLGHATVSGMINNHFEDTPPVVAIGFRSLLSDNTYRYIWLVKGRFYENNTNHVVRGGTIELQVPKLVGAFLSRDTDGFWKIETDPQVSGYTQTLADEWFDAVK